MHNLQTCKDLEEQEFIISVSGFSELVNARVNGEVLSSSCSSLRSSLTRVREYVDYLEEYTESDAGWQSIGPSNAPQHLSATNSLPVLSTSSSSNSHVTDADKQILLELAALNGDKSGCAALLRKRADPNVQNSSGLTCLHITAKHRDATMVRMLIEARANCGLQNNRGN